MFFRIFLSSLRRRTGRLLVAVLAVVLGASMVSALANVSFSVGEKVSRELRSYGPNLLVVPRTSLVRVGRGSLTFGAIREKSYILEKDLVKIKSLPLKEEILGYAPYIYGLAEVGSDKVVVTGTHLDQVKRISPWWQVKGRWIKDRQDDTASIIGTEVSEKLKLNLGDSYEVKGKRESKNLTVAGIVTTGGSEDNQIFVNLGVGQKLTGQVGRIDLIQVSVLGKRRSLEAVAREIELAIPKVRAKVVKQIAQTEGVLLTKIQLLILIVAILVLIGAALSVMSTMLITVFERKREIGLMRALGAQQASIVALFLSEAGVIGLLGGIIGYFTGLVFAQLIGKAVFGASISPHPLVVPILLILSVGVTLVASILPVNRAIHTEPAVVLRGE